MDGSPCARTDEPVDVLAVATAAFLPQLPLLPLIAMLTGVMAVGCGAMLVLRRLAGGIAAPPAAAAVLAVCGAGLLLVTVCDLAMRAAAARTSRAASWLPAVLTLSGAHAAAGMACAARPADGSGRGQPAASDDAVLGCPHYDRGGRGLARNRSPWLALAKASPFRGP
jgi:hypothetical protein